MNCPRTLVSECYELIDKNVKLQGWVHRVRKLGNISFLQLRDRSGIIQCVLEGKLLDLKFDVESVIEIYGVVVSSPKTKLGVEIHATEINVLNPSGPLPFNINNKDLDIGLNIILNNRVLSLRHKKVNAVFKIKSKVIESFNSFLTNQGFIRIFTPKIVSQGAEGGANVFRLNYFENKAFLAQSPQFYKQMMVAAGFERVFEVGAVYRAEEHDSSRHLNEYISLDVEMGFINDFGDVMNLEENLIKYIFKNLKIECEEELDLLGIIIPDLYNFPRLTLEQAHAILLNHYNKTSPTGDLDTVGEKLISKYIFEQFNTPFVFITHYPKETRPMYSMPNNDNPELTDTFDLLFNGIEITSGGQRIHEQELLINSFKEKNLNLEDFQFYIDIFNQGVPPHGGFAIGLERFIAKLLKLDNIREASEFPRDRKRINP